MFGAKPGVGPRPKPHLSAVFACDQAREREALDGTTMILCLIWPDEGICSRLL